MLGCPWQRCTVHFLREALGHARREQQPMLAALIRPIFDNDDGAAARAQLGEALERPPRAGRPLAGAVWPAAEEDLLESAPHTLRWSE